MARSTSIVYNFIYVTVGLLYPAYCSMVALSTKGTSDDNAWLMYWVVLSLFNFFEYFGDYIFSWFPLYPLVKLGFISWCVAPIPQNGAYYLYKVFIAPFYHMYGGHIDDFITDILFYSKQYLGQTPIIQK